MQILVVMLALLSNCLFADIKALGLKSNYQFEKDLERILVLHLSNDVNRKGHLLSFPTDAVPKYKRLVIGIINYPLEELFVVENSDDLTKCIKEDDRILYYLIDSWLI